jgi:hypothetical protein
MSDSVSSTHFKVSAARGMLDVALVAAFSTHLAAWAGLGVGCAFAHESWLAVVMACVSGAVGLLTLWLLVRVAIDRRLFAALARPSLSPTNSADPLNALDQALLELGWIDEKKAARSIDARVRGVSGLLKKVIVLMLIQVLVVCIVIPLHAF